MVYRTFDIEELGEAMWPHRDEVEGFEPVEWLNNQMNIALTNGEGDYGLFEYGSDGVYTGHYFFVKRGREAKALAIEMLQTMFGKYNLPFIRGLTPVENLGAKWMSRQLGFTSWGVVDTGVDLCELFIQTQEEWAERQEETN